MAKVKRSSRILCNYLVQIFYKGVVRLGILDAYERWIIKRHVQKVCIFKMRMSRWNSIDK